MIGVFLYGVMAAFPLAILLGLLIDRQVAITCIAIAAVVFPLAAWRWMSASEVVEQASAVRDPFISWSRESCRGHRGVLLMFMDARPEAKVRWWVKCRDGSKAGIVQAPRSGFPGVYRPSAPATVV